MATVTVHGFDVEVVPSVEPYRSRQIAWVEALRSGGYSQAYGQLKFADRYCCLGVACDISDIDSFSDTGRYMGLRSTLPESVHQYFGIDSGVGFTVIRGIESFNLIGLNDTMEFSFDQIADVIEAHFALASPTPRELEGQK